MVMEYRSFISVLFVVSELKIMAFGRVILYNAFFKLLCIMCNVLYYDQPHNILGTFKYMMTSHCIGCIWERGAFTMKFAKNLSFTNTTRYRSSSTLSFASDRDPAEAEEMPVHRHMSKKHRRANMVYACGLNATGALGLVNSSKKKHLSSAIFPHRIWLGDLKIATADCGYGYTVLGSSCKDLVKVYGMGINTESQLGFHVSKNESPETPSNNKFYDFLMEPSPIHIPFENFRKTSVQQVSCGRAHTLILTDREGIFSFGNNAYGQCGRRIIDGELFQGSRKVHQIRHKHFSSPVVQVSCGMDHSLFLTKQGKVYSCGWGADGQTGLGHYRKTAEPTEVKGDLEGVNVKKVTTFADMSLAICHDGYLFGWGNSEYFQLGSVTDDSQVHTPRRLPFNQVGKIVDAAAGGTICCLLNEHGEVWVWGYGILGKGPDLSDCKYPEPLPMTLFGQSAFSPDVKVKKVKCGMHHFAAINNKSELFTWGKNKAGSLGIAKLRNQYFPWKVLVPAPVIDVSCGVDHMIIIARSIV